MSPSMTKTAMVRARINPKTKAEADKLLSEYGMTHSTFINLSYHSLINGGGIPVSRNVPNEELAAALRDSRTGKTQRVAHANAESMLKTLCTDPS